MYCNVCGIRGPQGPIGFGFTVDSGAPVNPPADNRVYYLNLDTGDMYEWDGNTWQLIGTLGGGAAINETFNIVQPNDGDLDNTIFSIFGSHAAGVSSDLTLFMDRVGCSDDVIITITSIDGITFVGGGTSITILSDESASVTGLDWTATPGPGVYTVTLTWVSCGVTRNQTGTITLS